MRHDFKDFKDYIKNKKVTVVGIGVSNKPLIRDLVAFGAKVTACDKRTDLGETEDEMNTLGVTLCLGENYLEAVKGAEVVFRTPSMMPTNKILKEAAEAGAYVTSEMAEFLKYCKAKIFGVTGSDGKTTTTTLIYEILKADGKNAYLGGNIGTPLFSELDKIKEEDFVVVELSSFQLMDIEYAPDIAVITNLSPNHLDIHKDMDEYIEAKKNIFKGQDNGGIVVLNKDNDITNGMMDETHNEIRWFSRKTKEVYAYADKGELFVDGYKVCLSEEVKLIGEHNIENLLTAFAAVKDYASIDAMHKVAANFGGVEHRIEFVKELNGIRFYNDSIATSPTRTLAGLKSFKKPVILIAGGYDKNIPFSALAEEGIEKVKTLIVMGNTAEKIKNEFLRVMAERNIELDIVEAVSLEEAVTKAYEGAVQGDIITMSPACASFDMYVNFEKKGNAYKEIVSSLS